MIQIKLYLTKSLTNFGGLLAYFHVMPDEFCPQQNVKSDAAEDQEAEREEEEDERVLARILQRPFCQDAVDGDDQPSSRLPSHHSLRVSGRKLRWQK